MGDGLFHMTHTVIVNTSYWGHFMPILDVINAIFPSYTSRYVHLKGKPSSFFHIIQHVLDHPWAPEQLFHPHPTYSYFSGQLGALSVILGVMQKVLLDGLDGIVAFALGGFGMAESV